MNKKIHGTTLSKSGTNVYMPCFSMKKKTKCTDKCPFISRTFTMIYVYINMFRGNVLYRYVYR